MQNFSEEDWQALQEEINQQTVQPKIDQLESITILKILEMVPEGETWLICLGRFRVRWQSRDNFTSWWSPRVLWWMGKIEDSDV